MTLSPPTIPISCLAPHSNLLLKPHVSDQQNLQSQCDSWSTQLGHSQYLGILQGIQVSSSQQVLLTHLFQVCIRTCALAARRQVQTLPLKLQGSLPQAHGHLPALLRHPPVRAATPQPLSSAGTTPMPSTPLQPVGYVVHVLHFRRHRRCDVLLPT